LEIAGFVNYPSEWWHWSYGDKYWGFAKGKKVLYNQITENEIKTADICRGTIPRPLPDPPF
jgi:D-alanyl-D-alanine dipeptidase